MTNYNNTIHNSSNISDSIQYIIIIYYYNLKIGNSEYKNHTVLHYPFLVFFLFFFFFFFTSIIEGLTLTEKSKKVIKTIVLKPRLFTKTLCFRNFRDSLGNFLEGSLLERRKQLFT